MEIDLSITELLSELKVYGSIKHGHKLFTKQERLAIDYPSTYNSVLRWWWGENRTENIEKINHTLTKVFRIIEQSIDDVEKNNSMLARVLSSLEFAYQGIERLQTTYEHDAHSVSKLEVLLENIQIYKTKLIRALEPLIASQTTNFALKDKEI